MALLASFGTYFVGFAARPFGGILFGILGDRLGRKGVLLLTLMLMGVASTLIGCLPTYASIGMAARNRSKAMALVAPAMSRRTRI